MSAGQPGPQVKDRALGRTGSGGNEEELPGFQSLVDFNSSIMTRGRFSTSVFGVNLMYE